MSIKQMANETIASIEGLEKESGRVVIKCESGLTFTFFHSQDCCESVSLYDFDGEAQDVVGAIVLSAEEVSSSDDDNIKPREYSESWTWTFYKIETSKGGIWMRWLGESNGYYGEEVEVSVTRQPSR
jgi:hypothetical protein